MNLEISAFSICRGLITAPFFVISYKPDGPCTGMDKVKIVGDIELEAMLEIFMRFSVITS
ncbi:MAG: hypothetical protein ACREBU_25035 [Nitrososphaera sp.]